MATRAFFLGLLLTPFAAACSPGPGAEAPGAARHGTAAGQELYDKYCRLCHGEDGRGYAADNASAITNRSFLATASDAFLYRAIESGRPGTSMSAFGSSYGGPLDTSAIRVLIAHLRRIEPVAPVALAPDPVDGDRELGLRVYRQRCAGCHGAEGEGVSAISLNNPVFLASASDRFIRYAIEHGREGTPMPAYGEVLSAEQLDGLTALIRSWTSTLEDAPVAESLPPLDRIVIHPKGKHPRLPLRDGRFVSVDDVKAALDRRARMVLLDARPTSDWLRAHIPGAFPLPFYDADSLQHIAEALPRDGTWILAYCGCPHAASGKVIDALRDAGFRSDRTAVIDEGIFVWAQRGYPMTTGVPPKVEKAEQEREVR